MIHPADPSEASETGETPKEQIKPSVGVELMFLLFGTNVLIAYNTLINGIDFYEALFPNQNVSTNIARVYNIASSLTFFLSLPFIEKFQIKSRFYLSMAFVISCMLFFLIYSNIGSPSFTLILILDGITAVFSGLLFGTTMGYAGLFGGNCSSLATTGLALAGVVTSILRLLSKLMKSFEGWFYFGVPTLLLIVALIAFIFFQRTEIAKAAIMNATISDQFMNRMSRVGAVIKKVWIFFTEAALCMIITLTVFPGYASSIKSKHGLQKWVTTIVTTSFMVGDFLGRLATRWFKWPSQKYLWIPHVVRLIFFPAYILPIQGIFLSDDIFIYVVTFLLALTGGYFVALCITYTPMLETLDSKEAELGSFTVSLGLNLGVFFGSWMTYLMPNQ